MSLKSKLLIVASTIIAVALIVVIGAGIVTLLKKSQSKSVKMPTANGTIESGKGPLGPALLSQRANVPPVTRLQVQITKNGFEPAKLNVRVNTILQISNTTSEIFYLKSVGQNTLDVPNILPPSNSKFEVGIGYAGSYTLVNQKNSSQTLEITVKN